jgi:hypothetical protein
MENNTKPQPTLLARYLPIVAWLPSYNRGWLAADILAGLTLWGLVVPVVFTASETFDVGMDLGSPVALDYHERAPFKFNGKIEKIHIKYI